jgi:hypothetical protein
MKDPTLIKAYLAAEEKRRRKAIASDRSTIPLDFETPSPVSDPSDPLWKQVWKTEGIRWLGPQGNGVIDAMERFQHAFELGYQACHRVENGWLAPSEVPSYPEGEE